jgi:hypothetical protein
VLAPGVLLNYEPIKWRRWVLLIDVLGSAGLRTASNGAARARVKAKLGFRCSYLSKCAARVALFIGLFGPWCVQQGYEIDPISNRKQTREIKEEIKKGKSLTMMK